MDFSCRAIITGTAPTADRYQEIDDLRGAKVGVSRLGSGSHLMASVLALQQGWKDANGAVEQQDVVVNNDFQTLRKGVNHTPGYVVCIYTGTRPATLCGR